MRVEAATARTDVFDGTEHDCVFVLQFQGIKLTPGSIQSFDQTYANVCRAASVVYRFIAS